MKVISIVFTSIAILGYLISTLLFINDPIGRSTKDGIHLYNFFIWFIIPTILWVIHFLFKYPIKVEIDEKGVSAKQNPDEPEYKDVSKLTLNNYVDIERNSLQNKINDYSNELKQLVEVRELIQRSFQQKFIDEGKFIEEDNKLLEKISHIQSRISDCEKRSHTLILLEHELNDLEDLVKKNIITVHEMETKRSELIDSKTKTSVKFVQYQTAKGVVEIEPCIDLKGKKAFINGKPAPDGRYKLGCLWYIKIQNGIVIN